MTAGSTARLEHLRLRELLLLERVHELGSLRRVAESLHLTQPAVTQALRTLEDCFGTALVQRSSGGATLTEAGLAALRRLRPMHAEARAALAQARRPRQPLIRVGLNPVAALELAPAALAAFAQQHPQAASELHERNSPALWRALAAGALDAIVGRMLDAQEYAQLGQELDVHVLGAERRAVVAAAGHPLLRDGFDAQALAQQRWVLPPPQSHARSTLDAWFLHQRVDPPAASVSSEAIHLNLRLVAASTLLTVVPRTLADALAAAFGLALLPLDLAPDGLSYAFACRRSSRPDALIEALRTQVLGLGWPGSHRHPGASLIAS